MVRAISRQATLGKHTAFIAGGVSPYAAIGVESGTVGWLGSLWAVNHAIVGRKGAGNGELAVAVDVGAGNVERHC